MEELIRVLICLCIGLAIGLITVLAMKGKLKSVRRQSGAANYSIKNSMNVVISNDRMVSRKVNTRAKSK